MEEAKRLVLLLLQVLIVLVGIQCSVAGQSSLNSGAERIALLDLRSSLGIRSRDWPIKSEPCRDWVGIQCKNGRVTGINVSGFRRTRSGRLNPGFSIDSLSNFTFLESFNASGFALPGSIPYWVGLRLGSLQVLDLRSSSVSGPIPDSLGNLARLSALYLGNNKLVGNVPDSLGRLVQLSVLDLSSNLLTGLIPDDFALLTNLSRLDLSENYLAGLIPPSLGNFSRLQCLNLSDNSFTGSIPVELGNISQLVELSLTKNALSGSLPVELKGLRNLQRMEVGDNELEGRLPDGLFSRLNQLKVVVLSGNKFDGALPGALWSLPNLQILDVSGNNFTGEVSSSVGSNNHASSSFFNLSNNQFYGTLTSSFRNSTSIDLSGNYIQGKVPDGSPNSVMLELNCLQDVSNQRSSGDCRWFYDARGLTFDNFGVQGPTQPPQTESVSKKSKIWIYILVGILGGIGFITIWILMIFLVLRKCNRTIGNQRGGANVGPVPEGDSSAVPKDSTSSASVTGEPFKYEQLLSITGRFNETNLIKHGHSGDLFRGIMEGGITVVIKKVNVHSLKRESYEVELELFRKCSHTRLVPLLGHCLENENDKLLVYKYMPNGNLADSLHRVTNSEDDGLTSLDWITRLKIAIGAAEGLAYLHHECNPPLVHRDVQASSILLDDQFEVRLGSLSEVRVQEGDSHQNVVTRFLRKTKSFGSEPSTSGSSTTTCSYDVYCFGKVLLELVTGKLGISKSDDAVTKEWLENTLASISIYDKELVSKIIDPSLIVDEDLLEEVWAMAIVARSCLNPKPSKRPPMKYILKALENPLKVVREDSYSSGRLRTTSSRRSWSAAVFGSWRHSSENASAFGQTNRDGTGGLKLPGRVGSHGSGRIDHSSSNKRMCNEIFPEPLEMEDMEEEGEH
ncbi:hypothetical protein Tsubulata_022477 [Turnera subulata]|uniref:Protein kinase domain-containing protein n=1 Tax=Turnera subulata TaxID=218843 RepID=A0A9Q0J972_9ROSI|nr:hypothetical protein Tsubulata_022477 [Turnera subulata]